MNEKIQRINDDSKNVENLTRDYEIEINLGKTKAIVISSANHKNKLKYGNLPKVCFNGSEIEYVECVRNLGYQLNRTLASIDHTGAIQTKVYGALNSLSH